MAANVQPLKPTTTQASAASKPNTNSPSPHRISMSALEAKYIIGDALGSGAFSEVKVATDRMTGKRYAMKIIDRNKCKGKESMIETEVRILQQVKHENIIQLFEMHEVDNKIYLVMELVTGGELFDDIVSRGKYTESDAARIVHKIILAIEYLHSRGIVHRDLKPENLLLSDRTPQAKIMISDFGLSKIFSDDEVMKTACGTPGYVAPEVLLRGGYGKEVDLWSMGVITYILLCGYPPFYDQNNVKLFKQIMAGKYEFDKPWWDPISEKAKDFIRHLLVLAPSSRYTAREALDHPFIVDVCGKSEPQSPIEPKATNQEQIKPNPEPVKPEVTINIGYNVRHNVHRGSISRPSPDFIPEPRPLAAKTEVNDSGIVASNDSVEKNSKPGTKSPQSETPDSSANSVNEQSIRSNLMNLNFPYSAAGAAGSETNVSMRILSYDIMCRPPGVKNNTSDYKNARLIHFSESLKQFDVIALQELYAYGSSRQSKVISVARKAGLEYFVCSPSKGLLNAVADAGLVILSRYPIVKSEKVTFKQRGISSDRHYAKGAIYAKIALSNSQFIHVVNTHLQSSNERTPQMTDSTVIVRINQLVALKEFIDEIIKRKELREPLFLLGNFNINARKTLDGGLKPTEEYTLLKKFLRGEITAVVSSSPPKDQNTTSTDGLPTVSRPRTAPDPMRLSALDLVWESYGETPVTVGEVDPQSGSPVESVLTPPDKAKTMQCLDYAFWLNNESQALNNEKASGIYFNTKGTNIEKFHVAGEPFTQLSDHYGISMHLTFKPETQ